MEKSWQAPSTTSNTTRKKRKREKRKEQNVHQGDKRSKRAANVQYKESLDRPEKKKKEEMGQSVLFFLRSQLCETLLCALVYYRSGNRCMGLDRLFPFIQSQSLLFLTCLHVNRKHKSSLPRAFDAQDGDKSCSNTQNPSGVYTAASMPK